MMPWLHDRAHIRLLHNAHADHIEAAYRSMLTLPGNPARVVIEQIGPVRTFIAAGNRLENRAIFTGEESPDQIAAVVTHFARHQSNCVIEVNPANHYVEPPRIREQRLLKNLLAQGCYIDGFRCVWVTAHHPAPSSPEQSTWKRFTSEAVDDFITFASQVQPDYAWPTERRVQELHPGRFNYIGFVNDRPACVASMFHNNQTAYLSWCYTHPDFRRQGLQQRAIAIRTRDGFAAGAAYVFSVTDINFSSPHNLQQRGFQLAYNYLLVRHD